MITGQCNESIALVAVAIAFAVGAEGSRLFICQHGVGWHSRFGPTYTETALTLSHTPGLRRGGEPDGGSIPPHTVRRHCQHLLQRHRQVGLHPSGFSAPDRALGQLRQLDTLIDAAIGINSFLEYLALLPCAQCVTICTVLANGCPRQQLSCCAPLPWTLCASPPHWASPDS